MKLHSNEIVPKRQRWKNLDIEIDGIDSNQSEEQVRQATQEVDEYREFQNEIETDVVELERKASEIVQKFANRIESGGRFLGHDFEQYSKCFGCVDRQLLQQLMALDLQKREKQLEETKHDWNSLQE